MSLNVMDPAFMTHVPAKLSDVSTLPVGMVTRTAMTSVYEPAAVPEIVRVEPRIVVGTPLGEYGSL
jgi:hypothetical protein